MRSARQIAAAKRNIRKAQLASAAARRGRHRSRTTGHTYGKGRSGRKATKRALYGSRKHGLSPTQALRRKQRATKWKNRGKAAVSIATTGAAIYSALPQQQKNKINAKAKNYANTTKIKVKYRASGLHGQIKKKRRR